MASYTDQTIKCRDCNEDFVFTASEQEFFATKNFTPPLRCKNCRIKARARHDQMHRGGGERQSYPIVCAQCGAEDTVPFQPKGDKPVLCRNCFRAVK